VPNLDIAAAVQAQLCSFNRGFIIGTVEHERKTHHSCFVVDLVCPVSRHGMAPLSSWGVRDHEKTNVSKSNHVLRIGSERRGKTPVCNRLVYSWIAPRR
jgi:hypothetical protein